MEINGYTRTCGVIGHPVEHTMSPAIHNTLARELGENLVYVPFHVPVGHVGQAVEGAYALNLLGMNVTVPYKSEVLPYLKETDPLAETIGAVNTLVRTEGGFKGYNTDMPGLYRAMSEDGVGIEGEDVLILGAGGVARAVAILAVRKGARRGQGSSHPGGGEESGRNHYPEPHPGESGPHRGGSERPWGQAAGRGAGAGGIRFASRGELPGHTGHQRRDVPQNGGSRH